MTPPSGHDLGAAIRRARERRRMTQKELAGAVGVSARSVGNWETGHSVPKNRLGALEEVLGVNLTGQPGPAERGPLDDLKPWRHDWERQVAEEEDLPPDIRRRMITDWRAARSEARERRLRRLGEDPATAAG